MTNTPSASAPLLDLQGLVIALRARRRLWQGIGLLGLLVGALLTVLVPAPPTAVTRLLILHENDQPSDAGTFIETDVALLQTNRIAAAALDLLDLHERPEVFLESYEATGLTNNVLELTVTAATGRDAVVRALALAEVFVADHQDRIEAGAQAQARALLDQRTRLEDDLGDVNAAIASAEHGAGESTDRTGAAELETLYGRRAELTAQISELGRRAEDAAVGAPGVAEGTQIVDAPHLVPQARLATGAVNSAIGLGLGLVAGLALAAVEVVVRDRAVLRREIAEHLGASVIAQLPAPRRGPEWLWRRSRAVAERRRAAATLARAVRADPAPVSLLGLSCPAMTRALAVDIAGELAADGPVVVLDDLPGPVNRPPKRIRGRSVRIVNVAGTGKADKAVDPGKDRVGAGERLIGVGSAGPGTAWTDLPRLGTQTVLVVRAGSVSRSWLHTVARQLAGLGIPVIGVVLVDPDPRDASDGTLWDGLHTALRGRAAWLAGRSGAGVPFARRAPVASVRSGNGKGSCSGRLPTETFVAARPAEVETTDLIGATGSLDIRPSRR